MKWRIKWICDGVVYAGYYYGDLCGLANGGLMTVKTESGLQCSSMFSIISCEKMEIY